MYHDTFHCIKYDNYEIRLLGNLQLYQLDQFHSVDMQQYILNNLVQVEQRLTCTLSSTQVKVVLKISKGQK